VTEVNARRRVLVPVIAIVIVLAALFGVATYGLITFRPHPTRPRAVGTATASEASPSATVPSNTPAPSETPNPPSEDAGSWQTCPLPNTDNPIGYAEAVASELLGWSTTAGISLDEYANQLLCDADPSGVEVNGLVSDLGNYFPSEDAWARLREYETSQRLEITDSYIPKSWSNIVRDNGEQLPEGATAVTVEGVRHRDGIVDGKLTTSRSTVAFTVFLGCQRGYGRCHLLRLSQLDNPLK
jgi:hypothetical protein